MGLLDPFGGGGGGKEDDPYADILTPGQRNQMLTQGLLAMAGAFADAGMPSRLPIPFGAALGKAAAALGTGQEAGMKAAIENALAAQKVRDLRNLSQFRNQFFGDQNTLNDRVRDLLAPGGGAVPAARPGAAPAGTYVGPGAGAKPAADAPLTVDRLPYPDTAGGGLLGGGDTDLTGGLPGNIPSGGSGVDTDLLTGGGLLAAAPPAQRAAPASPSAINKKAYGVATPEEREAWIKSRNAGGQDTIEAFVMKYRLRPRTTEGSGGGLLGEGSGGGSSAADLGAGGDDATPTWDPTFPQETASRGGVARGETPEMTRLIEQAAAEHKISPDVLRGLIKVESGFNPNAVSPAGAVGLAQLMPGTARGLGVTDPTDPAQAIPAGARYLRAGLDASGGDINKALMYYHGGPNQAMWGPRTQAYPGAVLAAAGQPSMTAGSGGSTEPPDPYASFAGPPPGGPPQAAPGAVPQMAPSAAPGMPQIQAPPGADPAKFNALLLELARRNAAAEVLGMGNPYGSMLSVLQGSPQYKAAVEGATETAKRAAGLPFVGEEKRLGAEGELPSLMKRDAAKAVLDQINKEAEQKGAAALKPAEIIVKDPQGGVMKIQGTEYQKALIANGFSVPELNVQGMYGPPTSTPNIPGLSSPGTPPPTRTPAGPGTAGGLTPAGEPVLNPGQTESQKGLAAAGVKALEDTHAGELAANRRDQQLGQLAEAMQGFTPGATADLRVRGQAILRDLGLIKGDEVPSAETFQRAARQLQLTAAPKGQGSVSNYERELYGEAVVSLANTPEGVAKAIDIARRLDQYDRSVAQIHRDVAKENGGTPNLIEAQQRIARLGPPLSAGEINSLEQIRAGKVPGPGQAPSGGAGIDKAAYDRLPSGATFTAPDGSQRVKP